VGSLVELLGVERATETQGDTLTEEDVVGEGSNTAVVDLDLGKGDGVDAVLAGNLETDSVAGLGVPGSLGTGLNLAVDLVVVRGSKDAQVVGGSDGSAVLGTGIADGGAVGSDGSLVNVVASAGTGKETLVADNGVDVGSGALEEVEECTAVEAGLLEEQVELGALSSGGGEEVEETLELKALGDSVVDLELGVESVGGVPGLGEGQACEAKKGLVGASWGLKKIRSTTIPVPFNRLQTEKVSSEARGLVQVSKDILRVLRVLHVCGTVPVGLSVYFPSIWRRKASVSVGSPEDSRKRGFTYGSRGGLFVAGLASDLEGDTVGGGVLELEGGGREVVEILVKELGGEK
jgi:hypothetical protein